MCSSHLEATAPIHKQPKHGKKTCNGTGTSGVIQVSRSQRSKPNDFEKTIILAAIKIPALKKRVYKTSFLDNDKIVREPHRLQLFRRALQRCFTGKLQK